MYSYSSGAQLSYQNDQQRPDPGRGELGRDYYYRTETEPRVVKEEINDGREEEEEEPVLALDLRIGKATESISIFDDKNVLASASSGFGPSLPRAGQTRIATESPAPYVMHRRKSNSTFSAIQGTDSASKSLNGLRLFRTPQNKVSPRQVDCRKRFLEAALASPPSPSPPPPPPPAPSSHSMLDSIRRESLINSQLMLDSNFAMRHYRARMEAGQPPELMPNGRVSGHPKFSLWRPNVGLHPHASPMQGQVMSNPNYPYKGPIPNHLQQHSMSVDRSRTPIMEYPPINRDRSPQFPGPQVNQRAFDCPPFHSKFSPQRSSSHSFSSQLHPVQSNDEDFDPPIKSEVQSPPPPPSDLPLSPSSPGFFQHHNSGLDQDRVRPFQDSYLADRVRDSPAGYASDPVEYKSTYLHHVLQRQRQQVHFPIQNKVHNRRA